MTPPTLPSVDEMRPSLRLYLCRTHQAVPTAKKKVDNLLIKFKAASADEMCAFLCRASQRSALVGHSGPSRPDRAHVGHQV